MRALLFCLWTEKGMIEKIKNVVERTSASFMRMICFAPLFRTEQALFKSCRDSMTFLKKSLYSIACNKF